MRSKVSRGRLPPSPFFQLKNVLRLGLPSSTCACSLVSCQSPTILKNAFFATLDVRPSSRSMLLPGAGVVSISPNMDSQDAKSISGLTPDEMSADHRES